MIEAEGRVEQTHYSLKYGKVLHMCGCYLGLTNIHNNSCKQFAPYKL